MHGGCRWRAPGLAGARTLLNRFTRLVAENCASSDSSRRIHIRG
jgi:hypothetical protein